VVDQRIVAEVRDCYDNGNCIQRIIDSPSFDSSRRHLSRDDYSKFSITATPNDIAEDGYPVLKSGVAPMDSDNDGMPDEWEAQNGLNPKYDDSASNNFHQIYTNIEFYINLIVENFHKNKDGSKTKLSPPKSFRPKNF